MKRCSPFSTCSEDMRLCLGSGAVVAIVDISHAELHRP